MPSLKRTGTSPASALWHERHLPLHLGCGECPDREFCGGLQTRAPFIDCRELCPCNWGQPCAGVCRRNHRDFVKRVREIDGFGLETVPRVAPVATEIEPFVPVVYDASNRVSALDADTVAIPLMSLFDRRTACARVHTREELARRFRLSSRTRVVLTGVGRDQAIEAWWNFSNRPALIALLRDLGIVLVTAPNYSLILNVPRQDNLHNMKRIAIVWAEFMAGGVACALHVNGRTPYDYSRWRDFIADRPEVGHIAFEFGTGAGSSIRSPFHVGELIALARHACRPLHLVVRGGRRHWPELARAFARVSVLDAEPYVKAKKRQRPAGRPEDAAGWRSSPTLDGAPLDGLLRDNIAHCRAATMLKMSPPVRRTHDSDAEPRHVGALLQAGAAKVG
jgi:hypothetical protein